MTYNGKKFYCKGEISYKDEWGAIRTKPNFIMTRAYKKFLREKREHEEHMEIVILKHKIEYQLKTYGEVDEYDLAEYMRAIQSSYSK